MKDSISPYNKKGQLHCYQEYYINNKTLFFRGHYKNDEPIGYCEENDFSINGIGEEGTIVNFYII